MKIRERIEIAVNDAPPEPCLDALKKAGFSFRFELGYVLLDDTFERGRIDRVRETLLRKGMEFEIFHSVFPEYSQTDFARADLVVVTLPEIYIEGADFRWQCSGCHRKFLRDPIDTMHLQIEESRAAFSINGDINVVKAEVRNAIEGSGLKGFDCSTPVGAAGNLFRLRAQKRFSERIIRSDEVLGLDAPCPECGHPRFGILFGPPRFRQAEWAGMDAMEESFTETLMLSPKALHFFRQFESRIGVLEPVFVE